MIVTGKGYMWIWVTEYTDLPICLFKLKYHKGKITQRVSESYHNYTYDDIFIFHTKHARIL